jgi:hypothetical protein
MKSTLSFFNANNLFLRYKMGRKYPGDISGKSYTANTQWGFMPPYNKGLFDPFRPLHYHQRDFRIFSACVKLKTY